MPCRFAVNFWGFWNIHDSGVSKYPVSVAPSLILREFFLSFSTMNNPLADQITKVQQLVLSVETIQTYQRALQLTWQILKETLALLWLILCLSLVLTVWAKDWVIAGGQRFREWVTRLNQQETSEIATNTGQSLLETSRNIFTFLIGQAKAQLGLSTK
jgi:hypothetical protein